MSTKKIITNTFAQIGAKIVTAFISIFLIKIITGYLDMAGYGLYSKIYNYLSIFSVIADLGLYTITVREISQNQEDKTLVEKISSNVLTLRTVMGGAIIIFSLAIAFFLRGYDSPLALGGIFIAGCFTLLGLINSSIMSLLQAYLQTEVSFIANVSGKILTFLLIVLVSQSNIDHALGFLLIFGAGFCGNLIMTAITWWYARSLVPIHFSWDTEYIRHILWISLPYGLALFLNVVFFKVDVILLSLIEPHAVADRSIALYSVPMKIVEVGMMYGTVFLSSLLPVLTGAIRDGDHEKVKRLVEKSALVLLFFGLGIASFLILFSREVILLIANNQYVSTPGYSSADAMQIVAWIFLFYFLSSLFTYVLIASNRQKMMLSINAIVAGVNIIGNILLIPHFSFIGSAWMTLVSQILLLGLTGYVTRGSLRVRGLIPPFLLFSLLIMVSGYVTLSVLPFVGDNIFIRLGCGIVIFGLIYGGGLGMWWWKRKR